MSESSTHPAVTVVLALMLPVVMVALTFGPFFAGCFLGLVWVYGWGVSEQALSLDYQFSTYDFLIGYARREGIDWLQVGLPAFGPPILGVVLGLVFFVLLVRFVKYTFAV